MVEDVAKNRGGGRRALPRPDVMVNRLGVTVPEAAAMLGLSRNFTYQMVKQGKLPSVKLGKRLLIPRAALEKMLEKGVQ